MTRPSETTNRIHHTGIVVRSLDEACALYRDTLGMRLVKEAVMPDQGVRAALLAMDGGLFELLEPIEPDTGVARFLESRGEGMHHVCLEVDDIKATLTDLKAKGVPLVDEEPREGLTGSIAFLHPSALHGVLVELLDSATAFRPGAAGP